MKTANAASCVGMNNGADPLAWACPKEVEQSAAPDYPA